VIASRRLLPLVALLVAAASPVAAHPALHVSWTPGRPHPGDVALLRLRGAADNAIIEGAVGGRPLRFFPYAGGHAALVGIDVDTPSRPLAWRLAVLEPGHEPRMVTGTLRLRRRDFRVQRLTLPKGMVDLDPATEKRAEEEGERLQTLYRMVTPERLWRGTFVRPVAGTEPGTGFGARRIINGQARAPHTGIDYSAPLGAPVVAANDGRVALVADYFFPGRLVVLDHGLGVYTLYFHLSEAQVAEGEHVSRGQTIGTVGATGRATGPHLHFGALVGSARVDPAVLLGLAVRD
jgi:hypothetical protein